MHARREAPKEEDKGASLGSYRREPRSVPKQARARAKKRVIRESHPGAPHVPLKPHRRLFTNIPAALASCDARTAISNTLAPL